MHHESNHVIQSRYSNLSFLLIWEEQIKDIQMHVLSNILTSKTEVGSDLSSLFQTQVGKAIPNYLQDMDLIISSKTTTKKSGL